MHFLVPLVPRGSSVEVFSGRFSQSQFSEVSEGRGRRVRVRRQIDISAGESIALSSDGYTLAVGMVSTEKGGAISRKTSREVKAVSKCGTYFSNS